MGGVCAWQEGPKKRILSFWGRVMRLDGAQSVKLASAVRTRGFFDWHWVCTDRHDLFFESFFRSALETFLHLLSAITDLAY